MEHLEYFNYIDESIKQIASKADLLLFPTKKQFAKNKDLPERVVSMYTLWLSVYKCENEFFKTAIKNIEELPDKKEEKDKTASYYTPTYIADYMVRSTLGPLTLKILKSKNKDKVKKIATLRICDPCVGGGIFLIYAHDFVVRMMLIANRIQKKKYDRAALPRLAVKTIFGVDINPDAVEATKTLLQMNILKWEIKPKLKEFVSSADLLSYSLNDKCDRPGQSGQSTAHEAAQGAPNTQKTMQASEKTKNAKTAKRSSQSQRGIKKQDSVQSNAPADLNSAVQKKDFSMGESA